MIRSLAIHRYKSRKVIKRFNKNFIHEFEVFLETSEFLNIRGVFAYSVYYAVKICMLRGKSRSNMRNAVGIKEKNMFR